jgi:hypothetical protein
MVLLTAPLAAAQPQIPPSEMPGRERERFTDSPVERFMKPGSYVAPPVVDKVRPGRKPSKRRARKPARAN